MPCTCVDINCSLLENCIGLCKPMINPDVAETQNRRNLESLDDTIERLQRMAENLEQYIYDDKYSDVYRQGFMDGFLLRSEI